MKVSCLPVFLYAISVCSAENSLRIQRRNLVNINNGDTCGKLPKAVYSGASVLIENSDRDTPGVPKQGDVSIANELTSSTSNNKIMAICTLNRANPSDGAPFCTLETTLKTGDKIMAQGTPPKLMITGGSGGMFGCYGEITTGEDFTFDRNGLSFTVKHIEYCHPKQGDDGGGGDPCVDDNRWKFCANKSCNRKKGCGGIKDITQCSTIIGQDNKSAEKACPLTCGTC